MKDIKKYAYYDSSSGSILGFYSSDIHSEIPIPHIEIIEEEWQILINNQGKYIIDPNVLEIVDAPPVPVDELLQSIRCHRNTLLSDSDWTQLADAPLTPEQVEVWKVYRQALRDFPSVCDPYNPVYPNKPM